MYFQLCFSKGDIITVTQAIDGGWWEGTLQGKTGWFPSNYVREFKQGMWHENCYVNFFNFVYLCPARRKGWSDISKMRFQVKSFIFSKMNNMDFAYVVEIIKCKILSKKMYSFGDNVSMSQWHCVKTDRLL